MRSKTARSVVVVARRDRSWSPESIDPQAVSRSSATSEVVREPGVSGNVCRAWIAVRGVEWGGLSFQTVPSSMYPLASLSWTASNCVAWARSRTLPSDKW